MALLPPPGRSFTAGFALTIDPSSGVFYAIINDNIGRNLYAIDRVTGQATLVADLPGYTLTSLAFHPANPNC